MKKAVLRHFEAKSPELCTRSLGTQAKLDGLRQNRDMSEIKDDAQVTKPAQTSQQSGRIPDVGRTGSLNRRGRAALTRLVPDPAGLCARGAVTGLEPKWLPKYAALTGTKIGELPSVTSEDIPSVFAVARAAQRSWSQTRIPERRQRIMHFFELVTHLHDQLLDLIQWENGKNRGSAYEEVYDVAANAKYYARIAGRTLRDERVPGAVPLLTKTVVHHKPRGVVGIISPWNYPLTLAISDALPALIAGNAVVLKPDSQTPYTALAMKSLLERAGFPPDLLQVVIGSGRELGTPIIDNADYVMFTGSSATGASIAEQCGARLIEFSAELGGKNPLIVRADAPVTRAARGARKACFASSGQLCVSIERIYVHTDIWDRFVPAFVERVKAMRVGASMKWSDKMGPLISQEQFDKVRNHVEDAVAKGARVLCGGKPLPEVSELAWAPTVLTDVTPEMDLYAQETFGPVVSLYRVDSDEEALRLANHTSYGLNAAVWTGNLREGARLAERIHAGGVNVNDGYAATWGSIGAPSGGVKRSGISHRHGVGGLLKYTEPQTVALQHLMHLEAPKLLGEYRWADALHTWLKIGRLFRR